MYDFALYIYIYIYIYILRTFSFMVDAIILQWARELNPFLALPFLPNIRFWHLCIRFTFAKD